jgi:FkbM family methyltransferase
MTLLYTARQKTNRLLRHRGIELVRTDGQPSGRRIRLTTHNRIQTTIDVGANTGDFAEELRLSGFPGRIISFEPTSEAFKVLAARSKRDPLWSVHQAAIGETTGEMRINVAANEARSSSFLPMLDLHQKFAPTSLYVSSEIVSMKTLGEALGNL